MFPAPLLVAPKAINSTSHRRAASLFPPPQGAFVACCGIISFVIALKAHFDGKVLVPDEPLALALNQQVRITVEPIDSTLLLNTVPPQANRIELGKQPGSFVNFAPDWEAPLPDEIWGFEDEK
ncbi:MAG TPA: hypothetical protein VFC78_17415 [Tepidisphaeraceae bacterium]|nr:hypothetical protein [Tepidisphaeraceae bacterium]